MLEAGDYAVARNKYRPSKVEVLWIAESPPSSQGFFYFEKTTGKDHLFRETMKAVGIWPEILIVKANVFGPVREELEKAGLGGRILNKRPIPFPSHGWQSKYRSQVRQLIR